MSAPYRVEFHVHTRASHDSLMGRRALLLMCRLRGIDCVAITDHNEVEGALAMRPWLEARGVLVIVGEEIMTSEGEVIGMWLTERVEPGMSLERTIAEIRLQGGAVYVPHPYDEKRRRTVLSRDALLRIAAEVDCIEVHNGRNADSFYDAMQEQAWREVVAINPSARRVVGCDAHCFFEVGRNWVETASPVRREGFPVVLDGAKLHASPCHPFAHPATRVVRVFRMLVRGDFSGLRRAVLRRATR